MARKRSTPLKVAPAPPAIPAGPQNPYVIPCAWVGADGPCLLPGTIGHGRYDGDKAYCSWHGQFLVHGRDMSFVNNREEFDRWLQRRWRPYLYCCVWTHHEAEALWLALQGIESLGPARACGECRRSEQVAVPF
jgi:hypothetical protein